MNNRSVTRRGRRKTRIVVLAAAISLMAGAQALGPAQAAAVDDVGTSCTDSIWLIDCTAADDSDEYGTGNTDTTSSGEDPWGGWETDAGTGDEGSTDPGSTTGGSTDSSTTGGTDAGFGGGPSGSGGGGTGLSSWDVWVQGSGGDTGSDGVDGGEFIADPPDAISGDSTVTPDGPETLENGPRTTVIHHPLPEQCYKTFRDFMRASEAEKHDAMKALLKCQDDHVNYEPIRRADVHPVRKPQGRRHGRVRHVRVSRSNRSLHTQ
jgi:hypothetical protein